MAQQDFGTIDAGSKSGSQLAIDLNNWRDSVHSCHSGATAPSYAAAGILWLDTSGTPWLLKWYDGTDWIVQGSVDASTNAYTPYYQGSAVGNSVLANTNVLDKTGAYTVVGTDRGKLIDCSAGPWTLTLTAASTLLDGWYCAVRNSGSGVITITPASGNIDNAGSLALGAGDSCLVFCNGSGFFTVGYDSGGAKLDVAQTWSADQNFADQVIQRPRLRDYGEVINAIGSIGGGTQDIDLESGNVVTATVDTSATTFTFSNPPASGTAGSFTLVVTNGGSQTVTWPASVDWIGGNAPTLTSSGVDVLSFMSTDGGINWRGFVAGLDMK